MPQRSVATNFTFEQQRQEINLLAADFWTHKTATDTAAPTYLKHDGSNDFTGQTLAVPSAFTINSDGGSGTVTISGNLNVSGTTTTVNTATLDVTDKNITIAKGNTSDATADGAGITIDSDTDITFNFVDANDALVSSIGLEATTFVKAARGQFTGATTPSTGSGVEVNAPDANTGQIIAYNRGSSPAAYNELRIKGSSVGIYGGSTNALTGTFNSTGLSMESGKTIGIGDSSGSQSLIIKDADPRILLTETTNNSNCFLDYAAGGILEISVDDNNVDASSKFQVRIDGATAGLTLDSTGLGVGTDDPLRKVDVVGNSLLVRPNTTTTLDSAGNASAVNNSIIVRCPYGENAATVSNAGNRFGIQFTGANNTTDVTSLNWGDDPVKSASIYGVSEDDTAGYSRKVGMAFYTSNFDIAQAEVLRITGAGDVVIGHTDANAKLHVASGNNTVVGNDTNPAFQIGGTTNYRLGMYTTSEAAIIANKNGDDGITFHTKQGTAAGAFGEAVRIDANGSVGIGNDNPTAKLLIQDDYDTETTMIKLRNYKSGVNTKPRIAFEASTANSQGANSYIQGLAGTDAGGVDTQNDSGLAFIVCHGGAGTERTVMKMNQDGNVLPGDDNTYNLGASGARWANVYTGDMHLNNMNTGGNEVDGSEGHWTMQEGSDDLFLINRNTGKKYKFNLTEVS